MPRGRDAAGMAQMKDRRGPFTDPRDSRLARQIRRVFNMAEESVTTRALLAFANSCLGRSGPGVIGARRDSKGFRNQHWIRPIRYTVIDDGQVDRIRQHQS
jgi:hypothetical protein